MKPAIGALIPLPLPLHESSELRPHLRVAEAGDFAGVLGVGCAAEIAVERAVEFRLGMRDADAGEARDLSREAPGFRLQLARRHHARHEANAVGLGGIDVVGREREIDRAAETDDPRRRIEGARDLVGKTGAGGAGDREQLASCLKTMASLLRDVALISTRADVSGLANPDVQPALERLARTYGGERAARAFTAIDRALAALAGNAGVKVVADWLVLQL